MKKDINHKYTSEIVCPYCGYENSDSWQEPDDGIEECPDCFNQFTYIRHVEVTYITKKIKP